MKICLVADSSLAEQYPHNLFVDALDEQGIASEIVDCRDQPAVELATRLAARREAGMIDRLVFWASEDIALEMRGVAGLGRTAIVPKIGYHEARPAAWWQQFQTDRFIALSRGLHEQLLIAGVASAHFQIYEPAVPLARMPDTSSVRSAVLWEGAGSTAASIRLAAFQCRAMGLHRLLVANLADGDEPAVTELLRGEMAGSIAFDYLGIKDGRGLQGLFAQHPCFITPNVSTGICPLTLSAIASGRIIVAPDRGWIQDYVGHLATGVLYDPAEPTALPWLDRGRLRELVAASLAKSKRGHHHWQLDQDRLRSIVAEDQRRWSSSDRSAGFGNLIRREASQAARCGAPTEGDAADRKLAGRRRSRE